MMTASRTMQSVNRPTSPLALLTVGCTALTHIIQPPALACLPYLACSTKAVGTGSAVKPPWEAPCLAAARKGSGRLSPP